MLLVLWGSDMSSWDTLSMSRLTEVGNMWALFLWPVMEIVRAATFLLKNYKLSKLRIWRAQLICSDPSWWPGTNINPQLSQPNSSQGPDASLSPQMSNHQTSYF